MKRTNLSIAILSLSAVALVLANWLVPAGAVGQVVVAEREYVAATASTQVGGDALYVVDNHTGQVAVFTYDLTTKRLEPRAVRGLSDAFFGP